MIFAAIAFLPAAMDAAALPPDKKITQYVFDFWQTRDGLPVNGVTSIAQTPEGYLWLGTEEGLVRFDGVRFRTFDVRDRGVGLVNALLVDRQGALWLATNAGLAKWRNGIEVLYTTEDGLRDNRVQALHADRQGTLWVGTPAGLHRFSSGQFTPYTTGDGLPNDNVQALLEDSHGALWIGTNGGLARLEKGAVTAYTTAQGLVHNSVLALHEDRAGVLWIGTFAGLNRLSNGVMTRATGMDGPAPPINRIAEDTEGSLWMSTYGGGILRIRNGSVERFTSKDGLTEDLIRDIHFDREGSLWIATDHAGLARLRDGLFTSYTTHEGLPHDTVRAVLEDSDGTIWIGTHGGGLGALRNGVLSTLTTADHLLSNMVFALSTDHEGSLWIGSYNGGLNRLADGRFLAFRSEQLLTNQFITSIHEDRTGGLWLGTYGGGLKHYAGGTFTTRSMKDGLGNDYVWSLVEDQDGGLWVGTRAGLSRLKDGSFTRYLAKDGWPGQSVLALDLDDEGTVWAGAQDGLFRIRNGRPTRYTTKVGLFQDTILGILEDDAGQLWLSSNKGVFRVSKAELADFADGKRPTITSVAYGVADGMKSAECNGSTQPSAWRARDGRLWFATAKGVVVVDPRQANAEASPPSVVMEEVLANAEPLLPVDARGFASVGPGPGQFEFHYTALQLRAPERLRFRYRMEPLEREWLDAGSRRVAYYTNLPPGQHRFRVIASGDGLTWNEATGASFAFHVEPHFYQTWWFYGLCTAALGSILWTGHRFRVRQLLELEQVRTRIASDLHDDIGSSLSQIAILSEVARTGPGGREEFDERLERIAALSRESVDAMGDIVWAINPQRDTPTHLIQRMRRLASDMLPPRGIELRFAGGDESSAHLGADLRRQVLLIFKEVLHNIVRHGRATEVSVDVGLAGKQLRVTVQDNGCGFDPAGAFDGQGLRSMKQRAQSLGAIFEVTSAVGKGTRVTLGVPTK